MKTVSLAAALLCAAFVGEPSVSASESRITLETHQLEVLWVAPAEPNCSWDGAFCMHKNDACRAATNSDCLSTITTTPPSPGKKRNKVSGGTSDKCWCRYYDSGLVIPPLWDGEILELSQEACEEDGGEDWLPVDDKPWGWCLFPEMG